MPESELLVMLLAVITGLAESPPAAGALPGAAGAGGPGAERAASPELVFFVFLPLLYASVWELPGLAFRHEARVIIWLVVGSAPARQPCASS